MTTWSADPMVGRTVAQYEILARLGGGAMGVVYRARDTRLSRTVALKFLPPQWSHDDAAKQRFLREAQAASATHHPNICTIHDIGETDDGQLFIVMACYEGETLKQRLAAGRLPVEDALDIATQLADGLARAHAQGVVHRDIKPGNLILTEDGVRIVDFGLATFADALQLTVTGAALGTAAYMSPEQVRGEQADARADVWAAGVVLYEMLAGHVPFRGSYAEAVGYAIAHEPPPPLRAERPEVSEAIELLVFRALHKDPAVRFQSGRELARALRQVRGLTVPIELRTEPITPPVVPVTPVRPRRRLARAGAVAAGLVVAAAIAAAWMLRPPDRVPVVIVPVANETGDPSLEPYRLALTHSLLRDLSDSRNVHVLAWGRMIERLRRFLVAGADVSGRDVIQAISADTGARLLVVPRLVFENGALRARAEFLNPNTAAQEGEPFLTEPIVSSLTRDAAAELVHRLAAGIEARVKAGRWQVLPSRAAPMRFRALDAARAFADGLTAYEEQEYAAARSGLEAAIAADPNHPLPHAWLSRVSRLLGDRDTSLKAAGTAQTLVTDASSVSDRLFVEAVAWEARGESERARDRYRELADTFPDEPAWLMELAAAQDRGGDTAAAVATYDDALSRGSGRAAVHLQLCRLYNSTRMNDAGLARRHGEQARDAYDAIGAVGGKAQALLCLVDMLRLGERADRDAARRAAAEALAIYERLDWPFNRARAHHYAAMAAQRDDLPAAAAAWEKALEGARAVRYGPLEAAVLTNLGGVYHELGDRLQAAEYYRESFVLNERQGNGRGAASSQANAGALMIQSGSDPDAGLRYIQTALAVFVSLGDKNFEMFCRKNLAEFYRHNGQFKDAERELHLAQAIANQHGFKDDAPDLALEEARWRVDTGDYAGAVVAYTRAIEQEAGPVAEMLIGLARVHALLGEFDAARATLERAARDVAAHRGGTLPTQLHLARSIVAHESQQPQEARAEAMMAVKAANGDMPDASDLEADVHAAAMDLAAGRVNEAQAALEQTLESARRMRRYALEARSVLALARADMAQRRPDRALEWLNGLRLDAVGPELQAQAHYWRAMARDARTPGAGAADLAEARRILTALVQSLPPDRRSRITARRDISAILG